ncbi:hypothetical protein C0991_008035 [Blastosporella zonata]|nr:hypothetical protein C0991_008035 [Blastosporella zonata]
MHHRGILQIFSVVVFACFLQTNSVFGSVYPTQPVSKTKFFSGKPALITWKDDSWMPYLEDMPHMKIDLCNDTKYITTLAKHVYPMDRSHTVSIPSGLETGSHYSLLFKIKDPPLTIWSADFTIVSQAQDYLARPTPANSTSASASSTFNPATAPTAVHPNPLGAHPGNPYRDGGNGSTKKGAARRFGLETMHLRLMSLLVPALVMML